MDNFTLNFLVSLKFLGSLNAKILMSFSIPLFRGNTFKYGVFLIREKFFRMSNYLEFQTGRNVFVEACLYAFYVCFLLSWKLS